MEIDIGICAMHKMKKWKRETMERIKLLNEKSIRTLVKRRLNTPENIRRRHYQANKNERKSKKKK